jgi:hypothetical protein
MFIDTGYGKLKLSVFNEELKAFFFSNPCLESLLKLLESLFIRRESLQSNDLEFPSVLFLVSMRLVFILILKPKANASV